MTRISRQGKPSKVRPFSPTLPPDLKLDLYGLLIHTAAEQPHGLAKRLRVASGHCSMADFAQVWRSNCLLLANMVDQGWRFTAEQEDLFFQPPALDRVNDETIADVKERVRASLRLVRNRQLEGRSVRVFLRRVERSRNFNGTKVSVLSLVDDGKALATELDRIKQQPADKQDRLLSKVIKPVIELCEADARCATTGLKLIDIWRYFRHTWSLEYRSMPGRKMPLLIRNAARPRSPIIGIAMLASPTIRLGPRDHWIGWHVEALRERLKSGQADPEIVARTLIKTVRSSIKNIRTDDLATEAELQRPSERVIMRLQRRASGADFARQNALQRRSAGVGNCYAEDSLDGPPITKDGQVDWLAASEQHLFVRKRAKTLARLLQALRVFNEADLRKQPTEVLQCLLENEVGRRTVDIALGEIRKRALSSQIADVSVCGAVAPYNELLCGKLVTLLLTSREVRTLYRERYKGHISVISSQLAGRPIARSADLIALTTTSLYGVGSSQYNRLKLRRNQSSGLSTDIEWRNLGKTAGFGTIHITDDTLQALRALTKETHGAQRVNYVFGEGSSPRLRQVREGLDALGIKSDLVLHHATPRIVYGCELVPDARDRLMGFIGGKVPRRCPNIAEISGAWRDRWLRNRIGRDETMTRLHQLGPESVRAQLWADDNGQFLLPFDFPDS